MPASNTTGPSGSSPGQENQGKKSSVGPIVGGVLGGLIFLILLLCVALFFLRRAHRKRKVAEVDSNPVVVSEKYGHGAGTHAHELHNTPALHELHAGPGAREVAANPPLELQGDTPGRR